MILGITGVGFTAAAKIVDIVEKEKAKKKEKNPKNENN